MCDVMGKLGIAVDGGKDSLSMAARVDDVSLWVHFCFGEKRNGTKPSYIRIFR